MLVRAIMVIACDAANAQRLPSGPSIPIDVAELSAVTKLLQVRVTENVIVPDNADTGQLAHPVLVKFRSLYSNDTGRHIGLWRKHGGTELSLVEDAKINRANHGRSFYHHSMGASVTRVFNQRSNNPLHVRTIRLVSVINELKVGGVDIGSIAKSHGLIGVIHCWKVKNAAAPVARSVKNKSQNIASRRETLSLAARPQCFSAFGSVTGKADRVSCSELFWSLVDGSFLFCMRGCHRYEAPARPRTRGGPRLSHSRHRLCITANLSADVSDGSWSCKNALVGAIDASPFRRDVFSEFGSFSVYKRPD